MADAVIAGIAAAIQREAPYTGGPLRDFETVGRRTFISVLRYGLCPHHKLLDFGCGALRLGYWFVRFLDPDCYFGIEPQEKMREPGLKHAIGPDLQALKRPRVSPNRDCDMTVFGEKFDFVVARSILTHTTPGMLRTALASFAKAAKPQGILLASYYPSYGAMKGVLGDEMPNDAWQFLEVVTYSPEYLTNAATEFGLVASECKDLPVINQQIWVKFTLRL